MSIDDIHAFAAERGWGEPIIFDSFAGGGGASEGIKQALGRSPDFAINHSKPALMLHEANHPETVHLSENVYKVDPLQHFYGRNIGLAWFSPDCKHFSKAKGGKPVERNIRDLCWIIPGWIERIQKSGGKVDVVIMENVEEFWDYGPLIMTPKGLMPDPERKGETRQKWCKALRKLGGRIEKRELRACDFGAGTIRKRLFIIIRFDGKPIVWPEPTHGAPDDRDVIAGRKLPWVTAADNIDWSLPCPSIFDTSEEIMVKLGLKAIRPLAENTLARVARGVSRYVLMAARPFLVNITHGGRLESIDRPTNVITGAHRGEKALISPIVTAAQHGGSVRPATLPLHTIAASRKDQNGVAAAFVAQHNNNGRSVDPINPGRAADAPLSTITQRATQQNAITAHLMSMKGSDRRDSDITEPHPAILAGGGHSAVVAPHIMTMRNSGKPYNEVDKPTHVITAGGAGLSLVSPHLHAYYGSDQDTPETEPFHTLTTKPRFGHVQASIDIPPFTDAQAVRARQVADFMRMHGLWDEREFVTFEVDGVRLVIVDIGMRMLTPRELYNAQGFPRDYVIDGGWAAPEGGGDPEWVPFSKSLQVSCVGNSVSPPVAKALVAANCNHLAAVEPRAAA
ncbi:DNA cytosine methyltransferase [Rhizobium lentis]|uniref:DNA cytosine methyltransferase n=1 Tax=Rhizobium lentis TaxID=1138194 RepID=UPI001C83CD2F|nr:DNA cytosine methyltransferase [Rhizobium lentis]MBX5082147.1 DNA cytosine methyltransferase [Rhizobium lentis]MBX5094857.1 DNA cytosine methyltransferase [Rhizobium lentis]MBX5119582.1 DNA cytosine methyltransferase [Rhizobium lentis]